jgi:pimeloyl-ACP methyl ester carboxylesterase
MKIALLRRALILLMPFCCLSAAGQSLSDSGYYVSFDKTRIHYETSGSGNPVLLVHGFMGNGDSWKRSALYGELKSNGYKVILIDLRGNGRSDHPHVEEAFRHDAEAKDIMGLMDFLRVKSYDLVGYSRGAIIGARVVVLDPRVKKAVIGGMGDAFTDTSWALPKALYRSLLNAPDTAFTGMKEHVRKAGLDSVSLGYSQNQQPFTTPAEWARVKKPILLIRGDQDSTNGSTPSLQKMIPGSEYVIVTGDHGAASGTPLFAEKVIAFLKK